MKFFILCIIVVLFPRCKEGNTDAKNNPMDTVVIAPVPDTTHASATVSIPGLHPDSLLRFARTLQGIPYCYASTDPAKGFDCSGFITYVFNHFGVEVPRSSVDFTNYGREIDSSLAKPGDLILFTGTDSTVRIVGHMGIIESLRDNKIWFIHSTSGKNGLGVVITPMEKYYRGRFVKVVRIFPEQYFN